MPLKTGKENVGKNLEELKKAGYKNAKQRIAIALSKINGAKKNVDDIKKNV